MKNKLIQEINTIKSRMGLIVEQEETKDYIGSNVKVYYNLHKKTFSVQKDGRIIMYADYVKLKDVTFKVREGGKERVRKEKKKNVHAFVIGTLLDYCEWPCENMPTETNDHVITYNPYEYDSFVRLDTKEPVFSANEIDMINSKNKIFHINEIIN